MVCSHYLTPRQIQKLRQRQTPINEHRTQWESVLVSVSVQYEHLYTIPYNSFLSVTVSGSSEQTILT